MHLKIYNRLPATLILIFCFYHTQAQTPLLGILPGKDGPGFFFDTAGREVFRSPSKYYFVPWQSDDYDPEQGKIDRNPHFMQFQQTPIVLKSDAIGFVFIDSKGRITDTLGYDYAAMGQFDGLFALARLNRGYRGIPRTVFLDKKGRQAFGGRVFYRAQPFANGQAAVQTDSPEGSWLILNEQGKTVFSFPNEIGKMIAQVHPLHDGLRQVTLRQPRGYNQEEFVYRYQYFNRDGVLQFELNTMFPEKEILAVADVFEDGISSMVVASDHKDRCAEIIYFDTAGKVVYTNPCILRKTEFRNGKAFVAIADSTGRVRTHILRRDGSTHPLLPDTLFAHALAVDIAGGRYELVELRDETTDKFLPNLLDHDTGQFVRRTDDPVAFAKAAEFAPYIQTQEHFSDDHYGENVLRHRETLQEVFRTPKNILTVFGNTVLLADPSLNDQPAPNELMHLGGRLRWSTVKKDHFTLGIGEALRHPSAVRTLTLYDDIGIAGISMPNLELLHIRHVRAEELPRNVFSASPKLKMLALYDCQNLKKLPPIPTVQELTVQGARQISNLEAVIASAKNLKKLTWVDSATLDDAVLQRIKKANPELKIRFSALAYEIQVEEAAPPVKSKN